METPSVRLVQSNFKCAHPIEQCEIQYDASDQWSWQKSFNHQMSTYLWLLFSSSWNRQWPFACLSLSHSLTIFFSLSNPFSCTVYSYRWMCGVRDVYCWNSCSVIGGETHSTPTSTLLTPSPYSSLSLSSSFSAACLRISHKITFDMYFMISILQVHRCLDDSVRLRSAAK